MSNVICRSLLALLAVSALPGLGCVMTLGARVYNLDSGEVLEATFRYTGSGKGPVEFTLPSGVSCSGEYVTVAGGSTGWGSVFASVYGPGGAATGTATALGGSIENKQRGSAVATCPGGRVFECEYVTSAWSAQGYGACKDNLGQKYRLMF
jgi:hypothetical protein